MLQPSVPEPSSSTLAAETQSGLHANRRLEKKKQESTMKSYLRSGMNRQDMSRTCWMSEELCAERARRGRVNIAAKASYIQLSGSGSQRPRVKHRGKVD